MSYTRGYANNKKFKREEMENIFISSFHRDVMNQLKMHGSSC